MYSAVNHTTNTLVHNTFWQYKNELIHLNKRFLYFSIRGRVNKKLVLLYLLRFLTSLTMMSTVIAKYTIVRINSTMKTSPNSINMPVNDISSLLIVTVIQFIRVSVKVLTTCFISYITLDFIPTMTFSDRIQGLIRQISFTGMLMELGLVFIVELILTIVYLAMTVDIIVKLVRKRRRYNNTNFLLTRPLMENWADYTIV